MTNQEAIEILKIERDHMVPTLLPERIEAMDMAISALQEQDVPDTNVGDMISRAEAIDALDRIFDRCEEIEAHLPEGDPDRTGYKMYPDYMTVWKYLHQLPSAQAEKTCGSCLYRGLGWHEEPCDSCTVGGNSNHYKPSIEKENGWADQ